MIALALLPSATPHKDLDGASAGKDLSPPTVVSVKRLLTNAFSIDSKPSSTGLWRVTDKLGRSLGWVARTLPHAAGVVGYRGPTEAILVLDDQKTVQGVAILNSRDTEEHVRAVENSGEYFRQFIGWTFEPKRTPEIDGVSGATLTSLALAQGVLRRLGDAPGSLLFPDPITLSDARELYPSAVQVDGDPCAVVRDNDGRTLGRLCRTGGAADAIIGYQGPTELLVAMDDQDRVTGLRIRHSFDNEPYVGYVRQEKYSFWPIFKSMTLTDLAGMDLEAEGVEGVSGATMTSMAVAQSLVQAAAVWQVEQTSETPVAAPESVGQSLRSWWTQWMTGVRVQPPDWACFAVLLLCAWLRPEKGGRRRVKRAAWLCWVIVVIGLWSGNLVSMALIAGWSTEGIAWRLAPSLAAIYVVAFAWPPITKSNPYCSHLCPHGALQQL
ncbi:MAG: FMN-binding protein, partial [Planctomycetota bacterium]